MELEKLIGKIAATKNSKRIGRITRIERLPHLLTKKTVPYVFIFVQQFMKKDALVPLLADKILKVEGNYVWFDILKKDFDKKVKFHRLKNRGNFADHDKFLDFTANVRKEYLALNISPALRKQERRRGKKIIFESCSFLIS